MELPMSSFSPPSFSGTVELTPEVLNKAKQAGPNAQGNYTFEFAVWPNENITNEKAPRFKGNARLKGDRDEGAPRGFSALWDNNSRGGSSGSSKGSSDLF
jgi:hypothetical protein